MTAADDESIVTPTLSYAGPMPRRRRPPGRLWPAIARVTVVLVSALSLLLSTNLFGAIGDSYGPMIGMVLGVPSTALTLLLGVAPAVAVVASDRSASRWWLVPGLIAAAVAATATALCLNRPRTHGGGC